MNATVISLLYFAFGIAWILLSDRTLASVVSDPQKLTELQSIKGLVYVFTSAVLVYGLTRWAELRRSALETETRRQRDFMAQILDVTPVAIYALEPTGPHRDGWKITLVSHTVEQLTGYTVEEWTTLPDLWTRSIHPEDLDRVLRGQQVLRETGTLRHEYRIRRADGTHCWIDDSAVMRFDQQGQPVAMTGAWLDVTARREAQERAHLIAQVFDLSQEGIMITDAQRRLVSVNRTFTEVTGYQAVEVLGQTPSLLSSGRHDAAFYAQMWAQIETTGRWEGEIWNRRKSGEIYPEWLSVSAIRGPRGEVHQYLGIFTDTSTHKATEARIQKLVNYDPLTGLPNQQLLAARAELKLSEAVQTGRSLLFLHLNVDRFTAINETMGHAAGDEVLREIGRRLQAVIDPTATLCRTGGDDFLLLQPDVDLSDVAPLGVKLMDTLAPPMQIADRQFSLSASVGIAMYPDNGSTYLELRQAADSAVHQAKREGRGLVRIASRALQERVQTDLELANDLRWALERDELLLHYQPQFDAHTGRLLGAEALLRWNHPKLGYVSPARFIPIAEEAGLIPPIGSWVIRRAVQQTVQWQAQGLRAVPVAVNLSAIQFRDPMLIAEVHKVITSAGMDPSMLELELTESIAMEDSEFTIGTIEALKGIGVRLSIDDFGTGYSSLKYLQRFSVDKLKIDQSFVRGLGMRGQDDAIVSTIIGLADNLGLKTIAEGVETPEELARLRHMGCAEIQGYLTGRPVDSATFAAVLRAGCSAVIAELESASLEPSPSPE
jgi:diguanylate cyclase (GGDEF)-like protein/PAS domain S-box-containing protein